MKIFNKKLLINGLLQSSRYHICIVGGGPVGIGLGSLLGASDKFKSTKVLLIEGQKEKEFKPSNEDFSFRTVALSPATKKILSKSGAWNIIEQNRFRPVKKMFVWEQTSESFITFDKQTSKNDKLESDDTLAYIVENDLLQFAITETLKGKSNVDVMYDTRVEKFELNKYQHNLTLSNGSSVNPILLVGADGYNSPVRKSANIKIMEKKYDQKAIVAIIKFHNCKSNETAWQRFTKTGPIAYLPLDNEHSNLIWSTSTSKAEHLMSLDDKAFVDELNSEIFTAEHNKQIRNVFPSSTDRQMPYSVEKLQGKRASFPLGSMHANHYVSSGIALIGDAAHRVLPLAGQGVNLGLGDAACLAKVLEEAVAKGIPLGDLNHLQKFETERQRYVIPVAATIQFLHELFVSDSLPFALARSLGLNVVNMLAPVKDIFLTGATEGQLRIPQKLSSILK